MTLNPSDSLDPPGAGAVPPLRPVEPIEDLERVSGAGGDAEPEPRVQARELVEMVAQLVELGGRRIAIGVHDVPLWAFESSSRLTNVRVLTHTTATWLVGDLPVEDSKIRVTVYSAPVREEVKG